MRYGLICTAVIIFVLAVPVVSCYAGDFSAEIVTTAPEGTFTAKFYAAQDKSRTEVANSVTIARMDKKVVWVLMPGEKMYIEQPLDMRTASGMREKVEGEIERSVEGRETISGRSTTKYRIVVEVEGRRESLFQWIDDAEHIPIKTAAVDGSWSSEFKNIRSGPQDPELFEIPSEYKKMSFAMPNMADMMSED